MRIEYQNVDIAQEEHVILKGVNFQAEAGEFVYLIGKVGTGKSSLLKTFYGELDVHTGSARVLDREMTKIKRRHIPALRKRLGIVFQDFQLLNDRTVRANLDFVLKATGWKKKKERNTRIHEVLEQVGMTAKADQMPYQLSGWRTAMRVYRKSHPEPPDIILADRSDRKFRQRERSSGRRNIVRHQQSGYHRRAEHAQRRTDIRISGRSLSLRRRTFAGMHRRLHSPAGS